MARHRAITLALSAVLAVSGCTSGGNSTSSVSLPPSPPDTTSPAASCTVDEILVPSCGAWLGASTPSADGTFDYETGLAEYEAVARNTPDILHFYKRDDDAFPTGEEIAMAERPGLQRSILFYNWKPSTSLTWRQIADGATDETISAAAQRLADHPDRLFLAIYHEPENDEGPPGSGMTAADYVDMYRAVVERIRAAGADNVVFVMNYLGYGNWATSVDSFYPGDDVVDWIAYDPYGFAEQDDFAELLNTPTDEWDGFYDWATTTAPDKPIMLGEWGFDLPSQPDAPAILEDAPDIIESSFPMLKALVYWNDRKAGGVEVRLDQPGELGAAYGEAYAVMAADPYFNSTRTDVAR